MNCWFCNKNMTPFDPVMVRYFHRVVPFSNESRFRFTCNEHGESRYLLDAYLWEEVSYVRYMELKRLRKVAEVMWS
jgi:hypothetical protein